MIMYLKKCTLALRKDEWKYIFPQENEHKNGSRIRKMGMGTLQTPLLYNVQTDSIEQHNLADRYIEVVSQLEKKSNQIKTKID